MESDEDQHVAHEVKPLNFAIGDPFILAFI
jgi:hypothetical protein